MPVTTFFAELLQRVTVRASPPVLRISRIAFPRIGVLEGVNLRGALRARFQYSTPTGIANCVLERLDFLTQLIYLLCTFDLQ